LALVVALGAFGPLGCFATVRGGAVVEYDYPVVEAEVVPVEIVSYPRYEYRGSYVYLVDGRWYTQARGRWVTYRSEPPELTHHRVIYERRHPTRRPAGPVYAYPRPRHSHDND
jgi:hypothetical protein